MSLDLESWGFRLSGGAEAIGGVCCKDGATGDKGSIEGNKFSWSIEESFVLGNTCCCCCWAPETFECFNNAADESSAESRVKEVHC